MLTRTSLLVVALVSSLPSVSQQNATGNQCQQFTVAVARPKCHFHPCESADKRMGQTYRAIHKRLDKQSGERLRVAQQEWRANRDANCELESALCDGKTAISRYRACQDAMTAQRIEELQAVYRYLVHTE